MEEIFHILQKEGKNTVEILVKLIKNSVMDPTKTSEEKVRQMFADVANVSNVEYKKFKEAIAKIAEDQKKTSEDLLEKLVLEGSKFVNVTAEATKAAATAFKDTMNKYP